MLVDSFIQNIDTLETLTGVKRVLQCHGSFATASCIVCRRTVPGSDIKDNIFAHTVPFCIPCSQAGAREKEYKNNNKGKGKGKGKRKIDGWNSDEDDGADDDGAPRHIMKVCIFVNISYTYKSNLPITFSPTLHSLARNWQMSLTSYLRRTDLKWIYSWS